MFHGLENIGVGVTPHHVIQLITTTGCQADVHCIGAAKQVVQVAHHLLVGAGQEEADEIRLSRGWGVQLQQRFALAALNEAGQFAIGIAGEVRNAAQLIRLFMQAMNGHHREELIDGPGVRCRPKHGKVAVIGTGQTGAQTA